MHSVDDRSIIVVMISYFRGHIQGDFVPSYASGRFILFGERNLSAGPILQIAAECFFRFPDDSRLSRSVTDLDCTRTGANAAAAVAAGADNAPVGHGVYRRGLAGLKIRSQSNGKHVGVAFGDFFVRNVNEFFGLRFVTGMGACQFFAGLLDTFELGFKIFLQRFKVLTGCRLWHKSSSFKLK